MPRIKLTLAYKGTHYHGWQFQPHHITVQEVLEKKLSRLFDQPVKVMGCSRTDSGVHARMYVCHFDVKSMSDRHQRLTQPNQLRHSLNCLLPRDIVILKAVQAKADFHAILSAKKKTYTYQILNRLLRDPHLDEYVWHLTYPLNLKEMRLAAKPLIGEHDFKAFAAMDGNAKTSVRRIHKISITKKKDLMTISVTGNGFLKNMVRNVVGTLVDVGRGNQKKEEIKKILASKDRRKAGVTAPAQGLSLAAVYY